MSQKVHLDSIFAYSFQLLEAVEKIYLKLTVSFLVILIFFGYPAFVS